MPVRLIRDEVVTTGVLSAKGLNNCEIPRTLVVAEGTVHYDRRRESEGARDGPLAEQFAAGRHGEAMAARMDL